ncbi:MAG: 50S ribosomal protein L6 [Paracoccaceae bacterium]|nr:50S ribosomal protein L6 [Paracoccaceae bacterium]MDE2913748.1 50S ribosomal protein L6 [Paracoccaceae bacterium]
MSRIGKKAVELPDGVTAAVSGQTIEVKGPRGVLSFTATNDVSIAIDGDRVRVAPRGESKRARQQWGMTRSQVANLVTGVVSGFRKELAISGVGFRARMQDDVLVLSLGYSRDITYPMPDGVTITVPRPTSVVVEGNDQQQVGQVAAEIRAWRKPEPYKGKGISYRGERVFRKEGKKK